MEEALIPFVWVVVTLPVLLITQRWIHRHMRGVMLLLTGNDFVSLLLYALVFLPGVFLHELSHWLTAGLLGVRTGGFSIIPQEQADGSVQLGYVEYYRDRTLGPIRESLIGGAPLIYGAVVVVLIGYVVFDLPVIAGLVQVASIDYLFQAIEQVLATDDAFLWLYLLFAVSNAMMPSPSDRRAWPGFLVIVLIAVIVLYALDLTPVLVNQLVGPVALMFSYLGLAFTLTIALNIVVMFFLGLFELIIGRITGHTIRYGG